jgi:GGDEF domain-containing protein
MADTTPPTSPIALPQLERRLTDPEPMCLAMVAVEPATPAAGQWAPTRALLDEVGERLGDNLRRYDELDLLEDGRFVVVLRTLADASVLASRMQRIFEALDAPYVVDGTELQVRALLGAAIRMPQEDTQTFLSRVLGAVEEARRSGGRAPVIS